MFTFSLLLDPKREIKPPSDEAAPPAGRPLTSRCPFLSAERNVVVREASMVLQEDIQEMVSRRKGEQDTVSDAVLTMRGALFL